LKHEREKIINQIVIIMMNNKIMTRSKSNSVKKNVQSDEKRLDKTKRSSGTCIEEGPMQKRPVLGEVTNAEDHKKLGHRRSLRKVSKSDPLKVKTSPDEDGHSDLYKTALDGYSSASSSSFDTPDLSPVSKNGKRLPPGVVDFDEECGDDINACAEYAAHIFKYLKEREVEFIVPYYIHNQREITKAMRCVVVDWMVEVQESFELNHETLYLAVKMMDMFLSRRQASKDVLQLVGVTCILIASKFDDRLAPTIDDLLYVCDDAYDKPQMITMEMAILRALDFNLGAPLSYTFLRRYARCSKQPMDLLTLARYILELSLVEYEFTNEADSIMAAAALRLALMMKGESWSPTLEYYSGYVESDLLDLMRRLNKHVIEAHVKQTRTVVSKYSHKVFLEVAKIKTIQIL